MKRTIPGVNQDRAFTLIELLIVVSIVGVLAALLFTAFAGGQAAKVKKATYAELQQLQTAIENYRQSYGFFPPDHPTQPVTNQLLFELKGTLLTNSTYITLDGVASIPATMVPTRYGREGFVNSSTSRTATDDRPAPFNFIRDFKPTQIGPSGRELVSSVSKTLWHYKSSNPTNNPNSFDLWVDVFVSGETWRISNWRSEPEIVR